MTTETKSALINNLSIRHGLLIAIVTVVLNAVFYIMDPVMQFTYWWIGILVLVLAIVLLVVLGIDIRKKIGGYWSFGEAFKSEVIMGAILSVIGVAYNFIIFKFVNPKLPELANNALLENLNSRLSNANLSEDKIEEYTRTFKNGEFIAKMQPTLANELKAIAFSLILYVIIALIVAACIKKNAPRYAMPLDGDQSV